MVLGAAGVFPSKINNKRYYWDSVTHFNSDIDTVFTSLFFFAVLWMFVVSFFFFWAVLAEKKRLGT